MTTRAQVVATARAWLKTPFREQQHVKGEQGGCDCAGLLIGIAKELGEVPPDFSVGPYKQSPDNGKLKKLLRQHLTEVPLKEMKPGDLVEFTWTDEPHHVGILVDYRDNLLGVVHAVKARGKVVEHRVDERLRSNITAAFTYPSVT